MPTYLEFERPIEELERQLQHMLQQKEQGENIPDEEIEKLKKEIVKKRKEIYESLTPWERVLLSRHPDRPQALYYLNAMCDDWLELHGDRLGYDDPAIVGGFGLLGKKTVMFIGQQKGTNTKERQYRNFGMANPEGYRKALRLMKLAEKYGKPVVTLVDTPGAFPGMEAEERGQAEAIARNLFEMARLRVPILVIIIGEGASGGALGIGVGDRILMMENTWFSVISPESCSSILWRDWDHKKEAAEALKLTPQYLYKYKIIDGIIKEPVGGAHVDPEKAAKILRREILKHLKELEAIPIDELLAKRLEKYRRIGVYKEGDKVVSSF